MRQLIWLLLPIITNAAIHHATSEDGAQSKLRARITPEVDQSDKKFFKKDYPWDHRPVADKYYVFGHPYPAVQDGGDYDRDFVKDENSDNGQWQAQMNYDSLRQKMTKAKKKLQQLKVKMEKEYKEWMDAKTKAGNAGTGLGKAAEDVARAKAAADAAKAKVNRLEGPSGAPGTQPGGAVGQAINKVEDEMKDLEKCKERLAEAKRKLRDLLKEKAVWEKKEKARVAAEKKAKSEAAAREAARQAAAKKRAAEARKKAGQDSPKTPEEEEAEIGGLEAQGWDEEAWRRKLEQEKAAHAEALSKYEKEIRDVKATEDKLARAAEELRKYRRPPYVDDNGGVYYEPKSSAFLAGAPVSLAIAVLATFGI